MGGFNKYGLHWNKKYLKGCNCLASPHRGPQYPNVIYFNPHHTLTLLLYIFHITNSWFHTVYRIFYILYYHLYLSCRSYFKRKSWGLPGGCSAALAVPPETLGLRPGSVAASHDREVCGATHNWPSVVRVREGLAGRDILVSPCTSDSCGAAGFRVGCTLC